MNWPELMVKTAGDEDFEQNMKASNWVEASFGILLKTWVPMTLALSMSLPML
jgi:hypothetical protein